MNTPHPAWQGRNIVLTGFMGTGKTTVGRLLADRLAFDFVDTDAIIEDLHGPIASIFAELGEPAFRAIEQQVAADLADCERTVVATGGRMMLDPVNVSALSRNGRVFCLVTTADDILERVSADSTRVERPLLAVDDPGRRIAELLAERAPAYRRFAQIATDRRPPEAIADEIASLIAIAPERVPIDSTGSVHCLVGVAILPLIRELAAIDGPLIIVTDDRSGAAFLPQCPFPDEHIVLTLDTDLTAELRAAAASEATTVITLGRRATFESTIVALADVAAGGGVIHCPTQLDGPWLQPTATPGKPAATPGKPAMIILDVAVIQSNDPPDVQSLIDRTVRAVSSARTADEA